MDKSRESRLRNICKAINSGEWGGEKKDALTFLGDNNAPVLERWSFGCPALDVATGGGIPRGRIIEVYGPESGGKTTICYHAIAEFQKQYPDDEVGFVDTEYTFDGDYASAIGVNVENLLICQPESGDQALNVLRAMIQNGVGLIVVDSIAALVPKEELEGNIGELGVGQQARLMSQALRILTAETGRSRATIMFTNQERDKIGVMYGDKSTTPGGKALKYYASIRLKVVRVGSEKEGDIKVNNRVKATITKSKVCVPYRVANFIITFGKGIDSVAGVFDVAVEKKIITKSKRTFVFGERTLGVGRAASLDTLRQSKDIQEELQKAVGDAMPVFCAGGEDSPVEDEDDTKTSDSEVSVNDA